MLKKTCVLQTFMLITPHKNRLNTIYKCKYIARYSYILVRHNTEAPKQKIQVTGAFSVHCKREKVHVVVSVRTVKVWHLNTGTV